MQVLVGINAPEGLVAEQESSVNRTSNRTSQNFGACLVILKQPLYPDKPNHPRQKYLLTAKGLVLYNEMKSK